MTIAAARRRRQPALADPALALSRSGEVLIFDMNRLAPGDSPELTIDASIASRPQEKGDSTVLQGLVLRRLARA